MRLAKLCVASTTVPKITKYSTIMYIYIENCCLKEQTRIELKKRKKSKKRKLLPSARKHSDYVEPKQAPKQLKEQVSRKNTGSGLRRSPRMPTATAKYWNSIKAELRNPNLDE